MPLFEFDIGKMRAAKAKAEALARARAGFVDALARSQNVPDAPDPLAGVQFDGGAGFGTAGEDANLQALVDNEDARRAAELARAAAARDLSGSLFDAAAAGIETKPVIESMDMLRKRQAIEDLRRAGELNGPGYADALNGKEVSPFRFNSDGIGNRYTGDYMPTAAGDALATQREMAALKERAIAGDHAAAADYRRLQGRDLSIRSDFVLEALNDPTIPTTTKVDMANKRAMAKPTNVWVTQRDGTKALYDQVPRADGGFDYRPAQAGGGEPVLSAPDAGAMSQETTFIAETLGVPPAEALKLRLGGTNAQPENIWASLYSAAMKANGGKTDENTMARAQAAWRAIRGPKELPPPLAAQQRPAAAPPRVPAPAAAAPAAQDTPPVAGARRGKDGAWYVQNGVDGQGRPRYARVDP